MTNRIGSTGPKHYNNIRPDDQIAANTLYRSQPHVDPQLESRINNQNRIDTISSDPDRERNRYLRGEKIAVERRRGIRRKNEPGRRADWEKRRGDREPVLAGLGDAQVCSLRGEEPVPW